MLQTFLPPFAAQGIRTPFSPTLRSGASTLVLSAIEPVSHNVQRPATSESESSEARVDKFAAAEVLHVHGRDGLTLGRKV